MKKGFTTIACLLLTCVVFSVISHQDEGDAGHTNAPGEQNCNRCHTGSTLNGGTGSLEIITDIPDNKYEVGKKYKVTITAKQSGLKTFGFSCVALNSKGQNVGNFTITDNNRTQINSTVIAGANRSYVTHKEVGIASAETGSNTWSFDWTAPNTDQGLVKFYAVNVSANGNGNRFGDFVYASTLEVGNIISSLSDANNIESYLKIIVDSENKTISFAPKDGTSKIESAGLFDALGNKLAQVNSEFNNISTASLPVGVYLLKAQINSETFTKKIYINQ